jgi:hypothetical protein
MALSCSHGIKGRVSLTSSQWLEVICKQDTSNPGRPEAGPLVPVIQVMDAKEKILKEIKYSLPVNTQIMEK